MSTSTLSDMSTRPCRASHDTQPARKNAGVFRRYLRVPALVISAATLLAGHSAQAASGIWEGTTDANWADANWSASPVPGSADTATFANGGNGFTTINLGTGVTVKSIIFDPTLATLADYTIGSSGVNGGSTLSLTSGGSISMGAGAGVTGLTETFNAPISLGGSYTITNAQTGAGSSLVFAGNITNTATSTLNISGAGTSTGNVISGAISNGTGTQSVSITTTAGTWTLSGANSYSGATTINGVGGTTILAGSNSSAGTTTLTTGTLQLNSSTASDGGLASGQLTLGGGNLVVGSAGALTLTNAIGMTNSFAIFGAQSLTFSGTFTNTQTKTLTNSLTGGSTLTFGGTVNLGGAINSGLNFTLAGTANTTFGGLVEDYSGGIGTGHSNIVINNSGTTTFSGANTYGGTTTIAGGSNLGTTIFAGSNSSAGATTLNNGTMQLDNASNGGIASGTLTFLSTGGTITLQSLVANVSLSNVVTLGGNLTVSGSNSITLAGTLSNTNAAAILTSSITGGNTLTLSGANLNLDQVSGTAQTLTINGTGNTTISSAIQDYSGGTGSVGGILNITNSGTTTLSGANTYTGLTTISGNG
ncbi:MAG: autotransporter-associated beta strand repeat-containing protein, partial [Chthoniobacteraceae bacterium]